MTIDDFRSAGFLDDENEEESADTGAAFGKERKPRRVARAKAHSSGGYFLGLSPAQRFVIAAMLLMMVCMLGSFFLVATERVVPPGLY